MYNKEYYSNKRAKLQAQNQQVLQRLVNSAFDFVNGNTDLQERINELNAQEQESIEKGVEPKTGIGEVNPEVKKK